MVCDPLLPVLDAAWLPERSIAAPRSSSKSGFESSCNVTESIMDGSVGVRELYIAVRWGGAGYISLMHRATDVVCLLYLASEQLRVRVTCVNVPRVLLTLR